MAMEPPYLPLEVSDVDMAFPTDGYTRLPPPSVFKTVDRRYVAFVDEWFHRGIKSGIAQLVPKEGIDPVKAIRHLKSVMGTWDTKHEHKIAGVAFLMGMWFDWKENGDG